MLTLENLHQNSSHFNRYARNTGKWSKLTSCIIHKYNTPLIEENDREIITEFFFSYSSVSLHINYKEEDIAVE